MGRRAQDAAFIEHGFERIEVRRLVGPQIDLREMSVAGKKTRPRLDRFLPARSSRWSKRAGRRGARRRRRCGSSSAARSRAARDRPRPAAIECPDRAAPCRGPSTARRRTPRRTPAANGSPASRSACSTRMLCAPLALTVSRSSCTRAPRTSVATISARSPAIAAIAVVLPPGEAQVSSTFIPASGAPSSATSCDASS